MVKKARSSIPDEIAAVVLFESDRTCCVCRARGKPVQLHHLGENPDNHDVENLAILCFDCHRDTQIRGGFDRKLDARQLVLYRDDWIRVVRHRRDRAPLEISMRASSTADIAGSGRLVGQGGSASDLEVRALESLPSGG